MFDGRAVDGCFVCELLYPDTCQQDCPRCGRRMRYQPAIMMSDDALRDSVRERVIAFAHAGPALRQARLIELLEHLHRFAPVSLDILDELGGAGAPDLDALRRAYQSLVEGAV
jgi:hypothetical protein